MTWGESEAKAECLDLRLRVREMETENERYKTVLESIATAISQEEEDTLGWISYTARMAKAALKGLSDE